MNRVGVTIGEMIKKPSAGFVRNGLILYLDGRDFLQTTKPMVR